MLQWWPENSGIGRWLFSNSVFDVFTKKIVLLDTYQIAN